MNKSKFPKLFLFCCLSVVLVVFIGGVAFLILKLSSRGGGEETTPTPSVTESVELKRFTSEEEFKTYLQSSSGTATGYLVSPKAGMDEETFAEDLAAPAGEAGEVERVSETTVQVRGIDEPDIVKTDGENIYFSQELYYWYAREIEESTIESEEKIVSPTSESNTKIIKAYPPEDLETLEDISKNGNLLLYEDILVIFDYDAFYGYDVSTPSSPEKKWEFDYEGSSYLVDARLYEDKIYLVLRTRIDTSSPCPITPLSKGEREVTIQCTDVFHPVDNVLVDTTYSVLVMDVEKGEVEKKVSFVGTLDSSVVYMSREALYITYSYYEDMIAYFYGFFDEKCQDLVSTSVISKLEKLQGYDISAAAKYVEFEMILEEYMSSLSDDEQLELGNELTNRMDEYYSEHKRDLERTGIVKVGIDSLDVSASGSVPGKPLNQFSLDEYDDHLRIATTIGWSVFAGTSEDSVSDVYVLDSNLDQTGTVQNLGEGERIYSVRFIQDKGYVVTFKEIDPFFVLDLSDHSGPELKGELKIPGYSSYLHPITKDRILGIGKEGSKVKLSLFDVSDPANPEEADKYQLDEYWSDVLETHHAFLLDSENEVFFIPGSSGGYIFSYADDNVKLEKAVSDIQARRAIYINDFLYIVGDDKVIVLDESDWEVFKRMSF